MSAPVEGDPKIDTEILELLVQLEKVENDHVRIFRNIDLQLSRKLARVCKILAAYADDRISICHEQALGGVKSGIEKKLSGPVRIDQLTINA